MCFEQVSTILLDFLLSTLHLLGVQVRSGHISDFVNIYSLIRKIPSVTFVNKFEIKIETEVGPHFLNIDEQNHTGNEIKTSLRSQFLFDESEDMLLDKVETIREDYFGFFLR